VRLALLIALLLACRLGAYALLNGGAAGLPDALCHYDCDWYTGIAIFGYDKTPSQSLSDTTWGQANWAFFPLYPYLIRLAMAVSRLTANQAGFWISNASLCVFVFAAARYARLVDGKLSPAALAVFLFAFPYSFYLSVPYTEGLYAALTMLAFYFLASTRLYPAAAFAGALAATRVTGILLTPVIAMQVLARIIAAWRQGGPGAAWLALRAGMLPVALAPAGLFVFMGLLYAVLGDAFAFLHVQKAWGRATHWPWTVFCRGFFKFDLGVTFSATTQSDTFAALCAVAGLLLVVRLLRLRRFAAGWFLAGSILLPMAGGFESFPRFVLANPIFMVFLFDFIWTGRYRPAFREIILVSCLLQLYLVHDWTRYFMFLH